MNNLREQYEAMAEKNRKEAEEQFKKAVRNVLALYKVVDYLIAQQL